MREEKRKLREEAMRDVDEACAAAERTTPPLPSPPPPPPQLENESWSERTVSSMSISERSTTTTHLS